MPRRKATENGSASSTPKQRSRKKKDDPAKFDAQAAAANVFEAGVAMQSHNGHMMITSPEEGAIPSSITSPYPPGHPGAEYFYPNGPAGPAPSGYMAPGPPQFLEPDPPKSPFGGPQGMQHMGPGMGGAQPPPGQAQQSYMLRLRQMGMVNPGNPTPPPQLEFRLQEMNRRLFIFKNSVLNDKDHAQWWDAFACEFFDDQARMTFLIYEEHTSTHGQRFSIGRSLIPRYFRTMFEGGVNEMIFLIRTTSRETHNVPMSLTCLDCDNVLLITKHDKNSMCEAQTECKLFAEFSFDDSYGYRVRHWTIEMRPSAEYISRDVLMNAELMEKVKTNVFKNGLTNLSLNYLKMCSILEPMQILMFHSKSQNINPKEALKHTLFAEHQKMNQLQQQRQQMAMNQMNPMNPPMIPPPVEEPPTKAKTTRKRQRKSANTNAGGAGGAGGSGSKKKTANTASPAPAAPNFGTAPLFNLQYQDVMVVGEPSMMGGEYGEEDERTISRVENTQYDPNLQSQMPPPPSTISGPPNPLGGPSLAPPHLRSDFNAMM
uniref:LID domain-containing protein n=1 Tax=Steinernema glaseri TaxID=37863 RepID=A0A1I7ZIL3_9BILA